jgi:hypothetical protein
MFEWVPGLPERKGGPLETDNRLTPRQPFEHTVQLERSRLSTGENTPVYEIGQTIDIGPRGLCIKTEAPLQLMETVRVYLPVQAVGLPLPVYSEVRWVIAHNSYYRAGLRFVR